MATFSCTASGNPVPIVTWTNEEGVDVATLGDPRIRVVGGTLTISETVESDTQMFNCTASNVVGSDSATVSLNVLGMCVVRTHLVQPYSVTICAL